MYEVYDERMVEGLGGFADVKHCGFLSCADGMVKDNGVIFGFMLSQSFGR